MNLRHYNIMKIEYSHSSLDSYFTVFTLVFSNTIFQNLFYSTITAVLYMPENNNSKENSFFQFGFYCNEYLWQRKMKIEINKKLKNFKTLKIIIFKSDCTSEKIKPLHCSYIL